MLSLRLVARVGVLENSDLQALVHWCLQLLIGIYQFRKRGLPKVVTVWAGSISTTTTSEASSVTTPRQSE